MASGDGNSKVGSMYSKVRCLKRGAMRSWARRGGAAHDECDDGRQVLMPRGPVALDGEVWGNRVEEGNGRSGGTGLRNRNEAITVVFKAEYSDCFDYFELEG